MIRIFQASTLLRTTPREAFDFHADPRNIARIAPPSLALEKVETPGPAVVGRQFRIRARQYGVPLRWTGIWERVEAPGALVDTAIESPFAHWRHSHLFEEAPGGCRMTDRVEYLLKGGLAGRIASVVVMPLVFTAMFRARHAATRALFADG